MIFEINPILNINSVKHINYTDKYRVNDCQLSSVDTFTGTDSSRDAKDNFTFNTSTKGINAGEAIKGSLNIEGVCYGKPYKIQRRNTMKSCELSGYIGDSKVELTSTRNGFFATTRYITGKVGEKEVRLKDKAMIEGRHKIQGKFGDEDIDIRRVHYRYNTTICGKGVDMKLMYYAEINHAPKYMGKYELDPDFLPILACLYRYQ